MRSSIQSRLLISASLILCFFLSLAGFVIDKAYKEGSESALRERLQIHLYSILASTELTKNLKIVISSNLAEPRFSQVESGLMAFTFGHSGEQIWRTKSSTGYSVKPVVDIPAGERVFIISTEANNANYLQLHYKAILENKFNKTAVFEFVIVESTKEADIQIANFRSVLWKWLGGITLLLIIAQLFVLKRSLRPLHKIVSDLEAMQQGSRQQLGSHYSEELKDIAHTINSLIVNERTHLHRYRNTLSDLAHSLKTPLTVLTGLYEKERFNSDDIKMLEKQTLMMRQLVDYQLNRAAAKGHQTLTESIPLKAVVVQITDSLDKVYFDKSLNVSKQLDEIDFYAERGDLYELFGNLLDNAYKWAENKVDITVQKSTNQPEAISGITIIIEDDGPGIADENLEDVLKRGIRADETTHGHGIGLAVVKELIALYGGSIESINGELGGQKWSIFLPGKIK